MSWGAVRFVVGVPALLVTLAYFLPGARMRRQIKADAEVVTALPQGELRDLFQERVNATAVRLLQYRTHIVEKKGYWLGWVSAVLWAVGTVGLLADFPSTILDLWQKRDWPVLVAWLAVAGGVVSLFRGGDITGMTPDSLRAKQVALVKAILERESRPRARRSFSEWWHSVRARWTN